MISFLRRNPLAVSLAFTLARMYVRGRLRRSTRSGALRKVFVGLGLAAVVAAVAAVAVRLRKPEAAPERRAEPTPAPEPVGDSLPGTQDADAG